MQALFVFAEPFQFNILKQYFIYTQNFTGKLNKRTLILPNKFELISFVIKFGCTALLGV